MITKKEIADAIQELHEAMIESIDAATSEDKAKQRKIKAHCRLQLARETVRALSFNN